MIDKNKYINSILSSAIVTIASIMMFLQVRQDKFVYPYPLVYSALFVLLIVTIAIIYKTTDVINDENIEFYNVFSLVVLFDILMYQIQFNNLVVIILVFVFLIASMIKDLMQIKYRKTKNEVYKYERVSSIIVFGVLFLTTLMEYSMLKQFKFTSDYVFIVLIICYALWTWFNADLKQLVNFLWQFKVLLFISLGCLIISIFFEIITNYQDKFRSVQLLVFTWVCFIYYFRTKFSNKTLEEKLKLDNKVYLLTFFTFLIILLPFVFIIAYLELFLKK